MSTTEPQFENDAMKMPQGNTTNAAAPMKKSPAFGLIVGLLFLALVLVLAGLYLWNQQLVTPPVIELPTDRPTREENQEPESTTAAAQADAALVMSTSNELPALEADLMATDLSALDAELATIDNELRAVPTSLTATSSTP